MSESEKTIPVKIRINSITLIGGSGLTDAQKQRVIEIMEGCVLDSNIPESALIVRELAPDPVGGKGE